MVDVLIILRVAVVGIASVASAFLGLMEITISGKPTGWSMVLIGLAFICGQRLFNWGRVSSTVESPQVLMGLMGLVLCAGAYHAGMDGRLTSVLAVMFLDFEMEVITGRVERPVRHVRVG